MNPLKSNREPLFSTATLTGAISALIALVTAFGLDLTADQTAAILGVTAVVGTFLTAALARSSVTPVAAPRDDAGNYLITSVPDPVAPVGLRSQPIDSTDGADPFRG